MVEIDLRSISDKRNCAAVLDRQAAQFLFVCQIRFSGFIPFLLSIISSLFTKKPISKFRQYQIKYTAVDTTTTSASTAHKITDSIAQPPCRPFAC